MPGCRCKVLFSTAAGVGVSKINARLDLEYLKGIVHVVGCGQPFVVFFYSGCAAKRV